jgi:hypothetical protein
MILKNLATIRINNCKVPNKLHEHTLFPFPLQFSFISCFRACPFRFIGVVNGAEGNAWKQTSQAAGESCDFNIKYKLAGFQLGYRHWLEDLPQQRLLPAASPCHCSLSGKLRLCYIMDWSCDWKTGGTCTQRSQRDLQQTERKQFDHFDSVWLFRLSTCCKMYTAPLMTGEFPARRAPLRISCDMKPKGTGSTSASFITNVTSTYRDESQGRGESIPFHFSFNNCPSKRQAPLDKNVNTDT